ncbi:MAG: aminotransferase class IV [Gammaproteobacteria bacterium]
MSKQQIVYLNGKFLQIKNAKISVLDRGFLFGDGVYEVIPIYNGSAVGLREHLERLQHSLDAIKISLKIDVKTFESIFKSLLEKNSATTGAYSIYLQITRGAASERGQAFPKEITPTIFAITKAIPPLSYETLRHGKSAVTHEDIRWKYCHIKSISLLPTLLLFDKAVEANADETILIRNGYALEGTSSNVFIVEKGIIFTPPLSEENLSGVTRNLILKLARENNFVLREEEILKDRLFSADEVWISSSSRGIFPIVKLDGKIIGNGKPGKIWDRMIKLYINQTR